MARPFYWSNAVLFSTEHWTLDNLGDQEANDMHESVVAEIVRKLGDVE